MFTIVRPPEFARWLDGIKDRMTHARLVRRLEKAEKGNLGDVRQLSEKVWEMREFFGPGWRMYYMHQGNVVIVMLGGGDKTTQKEDIARAIALAETLED
jgi:putative addiction module killer protein